MQGCTNFPKTGDNLKILGSTNVTWDKFHTEQPQILDATAQNLNARETSRPRFVQPYVNDWADAYSKLYKHSHILGPRSWLFLKLLDETKQCYCGLTNGPAMPTARRHIQTFWDKRRRNGLHRQQCQVCDAPSRCNTLIFQTTFLLATLIARTYQQTQKLYSLYQSAEVDMGGACRTHDVGQKCIPNFGRKTWAKDNNNSERDAV